LRHFSVSSLRLMTNNPRKVAGLEREGFAVERISLESEPTDFNRDYLRAKATKLGHLMKRFGTDK
jgi:GTP cyclohydrolase II